MSGTTMMYVPHWRSLVRPPKWSMNPFVSGTKNRGLTSSSNCPLVCSTAWNTHTLCLMSNSALQQNGLTAYTCPSQFTLHVLLMWIFTVRYIQTYMSVLPVFYPCASVAVPVCWRGRGAVPSAVWCHSHCLLPLLHHPLLQMRKERILPRLWRHQPAKRTQTLDKTQKRCKEQRVLSEEGMLSRGGM